MTRTTGLAMTCLLALGVGGCGDDASNNGGMDSSVQELPDGGVRLPDGRVVPGSDTGTPTGVDAAVERDGAPTWIPNPALCGDTGCQCSDGNDNDGDELSDSEDPECTGPSDNDESSFGTGIAGDNRDPIWQDCFFDGNSGAGNDGCRYRTECLTGEYPQTHPNCQVSDMCRTYCQRAVPNGCDCFGCCAVQVNGSVVAHVLLSATCSIGELDDPTQCTQCMPTSACGNPCGECELCPGRTLDDLPASCFSSPEQPRPTCENGVSCVTDTECDADSYCSLGCCLPRLI